MDPGTVPRYKLDTLRLLSYRMTIFPTHPWLVKMLLAMLMKLSVVLWDQRMECRVQYLG